LRGGKAPKDGGGGGNLGKIFNVNEGPLERKQNLPAKKYSGVCSYKELHVSNGAEKSTRKQ